MRDIEDDSVRGRMRFYNVITSGNILIACATIFPIVIWGLRLEGRVTYESELRIRIEKTVADQMLIETNREIRMEATLVRITDIVSEIRTQIAVNTRLIQQQQQRNPIP